MDNMIDNKKDSKDIISQMKELIAKANEAARVYEQGTGEIMSNREYDILCDRIKQLENESGTILPNSPSVKVGYEVVSELPKERHEKKMLSLDKTKDTNQLKSFLGSQEGVLSWKMDGLTVVLTYNNGVLEKAVTRGNGEIGEVVTTNAKHFVNIPSKVNFTEKLVMRGEAVILYSDFERINKSLPADAVFKNPRNLCSGSVRQLNSQVTASRSVRWIAFDLIEASGKTFKTYMDQLLFMSQLGFDVVGNMTVFASDVEKVISGAGKYIESGSMNIPTDGMVLKYNDIEYGKRLGETAKFPRDSIAFKWKDDVYETTLIDVEWSASKTGLLNPVAIFEPVDIDGTTVTRASIHNLSILSKLELGYDDRITVYKANQIIPQIADNLTRSDTCLIPAVCPVCGGETAICTEEASGVETVWCINPNCPAKGNKKLEHFVSRDAMNIVGISEATIERLVEANLLNRPSDFYSLYEYEDVIVNMYGFGESSFTSMIGAIEKSRKVKLCNLIYALSIPMVGLATSKLICRYFNNDVKAVVNAKMNELMDIPGVGGAIAQSFYKYFRIPENQKEFMRIYNNVELIGEESASDEMQGITICVTGAVNIFPNRNVIKDIVESLGGKLTGSVSRSTNYLVTNDTTSGSRKNKAAVEYGIPILSEEEFIERFDLQRFL